MEDPGDNNELLNGPGVYEQVHGRNDFQFPQLEMVRPDLLKLPEIQLPPGYSLRHYQPGDDEAWAGIMTEAFTPYWGVERFRRLLIPHFGFLPERVIFVCSDGEPIGAASAFRWPGVSHDRGYIHMVGVKKDHCGHGLGYWLAVACLKRFNKEGLKSAMLQTEDYRIPAIKHYLGLGFRPVLVREDHREKWVSVLVRIGREELIEELGIAELPVRSKLAFWWRTTLVVNYMNWLNFKGGF